MERHKLNLIETYVYYCFGFSWPSRVGRFAVPEG